MGNEGFFLGSIYLTAIKKIMFIENYSSQALKAKVPMALVRTDDVNFTNMKAARMIAKEYTFDHEVFVEYTISDVE